MKGSTILIVDDDPMVLDASRQLLESEGMKVICVASWPELSQEMFLQPVDLILLDVMLPGLNGDVIAPIIHRYLEGSPRIVLYSCLPKDQLKELARDKSIAGYLQKGETFGRAFVEAVSGLLMSG